jgi:hypothetical protein
VLLTALLAIAVVTRLEHPDTLAGAPAADPAVLPPVAGQCLLVPPVGVDPWSFSQRAAPLPIGSCDQPHYGEVLAVLEVSDADVTTPPCLRPETVDPTTFLGVPGGSTSDDDWFPALDFVLVPSGPDHRQLAAGQQWIACILAASPTGDDVAFTAPLRDALRVGTLPAAMGLCYDGPDPSTALHVPCDQPHRAQFFAQRSLDGPGPDQAEVTAGCAEAVTALAGDDGPVRSPDLEVHIVTYAFDSSTGATVDPTLPLDAGESAYVMCSLAAGGDRLLAGSLLGLHGAPIPWGP